MRQKTDRDVRPDERVTRGGKIKVLSKVGSEPVVVVYKTDCTRIVYRKSTDVYEVGAPHICEIAPGNVLHPLASFEVRNAERRVPQIDQLVHLVRRSIDRAAEVAGVNSIFVASDAGPVLAWS